MSNKLPTLRNEWTISANNIGGTGGSTLASYQNSMFAAKEALLALPIPWTVARSSNGTNYTGDGGTVILPMPDESSNDNSGISAGLDETNITSDVPGGIFSTRSITFDTSSEYFSMGDVLPFEYDEAFSISFWFRKNGGSTTYAVTKLTGGFQGYAVGVLSTGNILVILRNNVSNRINVNTTTGGFDDDAWHHVVCTYDGSGVAAGVTIYVDGSSLGITVNNDTLAGNTIVFSTSFNISGYNDGTGEFGGSIDDVAVYDKELTSGEVTTIYNSGTPNDLSSTGPTANLVGYWLMGDGDLTALSPADLWFSSGDLVWGTPPAAHAWIVLQHPVSTTQFCIDLDNGTAAGRILSMYVSFGGHYVGGDLTTKPTAKDEVDAGVFQQWLGPILGAFTSWIHAWQNEDGTKNRLYIATSAGNGEGGFWLFDNVETPSDLWNRKEIAIIAQHKGISGGTVFDIDRMMSTDSGSAAPSQTLSGSNVMSLLAGPLNKADSYFSNKSTRFNKPGVTQNEYVTIGDVDELSFERTDAFSISCWFRSLGHTSGVDIVSKREFGGTNRGYDIQLLSTGEVGFGLLNNSGTGDRLAKTTVQTLDDGNWHHYLVTYDGSSSAAGVTVYVDGSLAATTTGFDALTATIDTTASFSISGVNAGAGAEFFGSIDDVAVFDKELSSLEAAAVYNSGSPSDLRLTSLATNLVGYWLMGDGDTSPTIKDRSTANSILASDSMLDRSVSGNDGTPTNMEDADFTTDTPGGVSGYSMTLDGSNEYVTMGNVSELDFAHTDSFSISVWVKWTTDHNGHVVVKQANGSPFRGYLLGVDSTVSGSFIVLLRNTISTNELFLRTTSGGFNDGEWHHVVMTFAGSAAPGPSDVTLYVDTLPQALTTLTDNLTATLSNTAAFVLGARSGAAAFYNGQLDDVAIYNKELGLTEVKAIYNNGAPTDNTLLDTYFNLVGYWGCGELANDGTMVNMEAHDLWGDTPANPLLLFKLGSQNADTATGTGDMITERAASNVLNELDTNGAYPIIPISLISGYGYRGMHGFIEDLFWGSDAFLADPGNTYPDATSIRQLAQAGVVIHPWTGDNTTPFFGINTSQPHDTFDGHFTGVDDTEDAVIEYFQMVGIDAGSPSYPTYTSWVVKDFPDIDAEEADPEFGGPVIDIQISARWIEDA